MLQRIEPARQVHAKSKQRRQAPATSRSSTTFLILPKVGRIPVTATEDVLIDPQWLQVANLCLDLVDADAFKVDHAASVQSVIGMAVSEWASKHLEDVQVLDQFEITVATDHEAFALDYEEDALGMWHLSIESRGSAQYFNIKTKLLELEAICPGLGRTTLHYAECASFRTAPAFTPEVGRYHTSHICWYGMDNDKDFLEEAANYGDLEESEDMFLPSTYKNAFHDIFFHSDELQLLPKDRLEQFTEGFAGEVARVVLSIIDLIDKQAHLPGLDGFSGESAAFSCYLGTADGNDRDNMLIRVLDDFFEYANQVGSDGFTTAYGIAHIPYDRESFLKWRDEMEKGFALYTCLDRLVRLIGTSTN